MIKDILKKIESSNEFKEWKKHYPNSYLTSIFKIKDNEEGVWQAGYYNPDNDQITTITVNDTIDIAEQQEVAKFNKEKIEELNITKLKIEYEEAITIANKVQEENYSADIPIKKIIILQNMNPYGNIWKGEDGKGHRST